MRFWKKVVNKWFGLFHIFVQLSWTQFPRFVLLFMLMCAENLMETDTPLRSSTHFCFTPSLILGRFVILGCNRFRFASWCLWSLPECLKLKSLRHLLTPKYMIMYDCWQFRLVFVSGCHFSSISFSSYKWKHLHFWKPDAVVDDCTKGKGAKVHALGVPSEHQRRSKFKVLEINLGVSWSREKLNLTYFVYFVFLFKGWFQRRSLGHSFV